MKGYIKNIPANKNFGFIRSNGLEYFFHRDDYKHDWYKMVEDFGNNIAVEVEFDSVDSERGPRAAEVKRV